MATVVNHTKQTQINIDTLDAIIKVRVNRRAKRLILKVDPIAGDILVTAPSRRRIPEAIEFAKESADWIARQMDCDLRARPFSSGMIVPYLGKDHIIAQTGRPRDGVRIIPETQSIAVGGGMEHLNRRVIEWFKKQARIAFTQRVDGYCDILSVKRGPLRIRDARTRWASCSSNRVLSFSWRLMMAPPGIINYVAAHECVHLIHMNHSPAFWRKVAGLGVDSRAAADWFNRNGQKLFTYGAE